jgi:hypothetical protein
MQPSILLIPSEDARSSFSTKTHLSTQASNQHNNLRITAPISIQYQCQNNHYPKTLTSLKEKQAYPPSPSL